MKLVIAIIQPEKLEAVEAALKEQKVSLTSVSQVLGDGGEPGYTETYRGRVVHVRRPKLRLEIAVHDLLVEPVAEAIAYAASTEYSGRTDDA